MKNTRLFLGKIWKEKLENKEVVPPQITIDHPYIKEYENSIKAEQETNSKKKGGK